MGKSYITVIAFGQVFSFDDLAVHLGISKLYVKFLHDMVGSVFEKHGIALVANQNTWFMHSVHNAISNNANKSGCFAVADKIQGLQEMDKAKFAHDFTVAIAEVRRYLHDRENTHALTQATGEYLYNNDDAVDDADDDAREISFYRSNLVMPEDVLLLNFSVYCFSYTV